MDGDRRHALRSGEPEAPHQFLRTFQEVARRADRRAHHATDGAIEPSERTFMRGLRQQFPPPLEHRRHAEAREYSHGPTQQQEQERGITITAAAPSAASFRFGVFLIPLLIRHEF